MSQIQWVYSAIPFGTRERPAGHLHSNRSERDRIFLQDAQAASAVLTIRRSFPKLKGHAHLGMAASIARLARQMAWQRNLMSLLQYAIAVP